MPELLSRSAVAGLGVALPAAVVQSHEIAERLGTDPDWITTRTGIEERRVAAVGERLSDLAADAARAALADAQVDATEVDLVLVATCSPDELVAPAAAQVAHALGSNAGAIDLGAACTGFVSGLGLAAAAIEAGRAQCVLLIGAEILSRLTDPDDRGTAALFGDGAGAVVLTGSEGIGPVVLGSDGGHASKLKVPRLTGKVEMDGQEVFRHAVDRMSQVAQDVGGDLDGIDLFVFHQANARILQALSRRLKLPEAKVVNAITRLGNTSAASIPLALAQARDEGRLQRGDRVLLAAFGAGFTWGGTVITW
jgi:3-oxoacyl-[acyl-carrier-protein] synthase-3